MAEVLLFHHAYGLTRGVRAFADELRASGHVVHAPDMYEGHVFQSVDAGVGYARHIGFATLVERARQIAESLPAHIVYAGFSLGVMSAQMLAQTRRGARGALLMSGCLSVAEFGTAWPESVPVQIHLMHDDEWVQEGDLGAAQDLAASSAAAELFLYEGSAHLFADSSLSDYDAAAATQLMQRVLGFLEHV